MNSDLITQLGIPFAISLVVTLTFFAAFTRLLESSLENKYESQIATLQNRLEQTNDRLRAALETRTFVSNIQFEKEFSIYSDIWETIVPLLNLTLGLRPVVDFRDPNKTSEEIKEARLSEFGNQFNIFSETIDKNAPFYSPEVYTSLKEIRKIISDEAIDYQYSTKNTQDYWLEAKENREAIIDAINSTADIIRKRLESLTVYKLNT